MKFEQLPIAQEIISIAESISDRDLQGVFYRAIGGVYEYIALRTSFETLESRGIGDPEIKRGLRTLDSRVPQKKLDNLLEGLYVLAEQHGLNWSRGNSGYYDDVKSFFEQRTNPNQHAT